MIDGVRILWIVTAAVSLSGAYVLESHYERSISASRMRIEMLYRNTTNNQRIVAHAAELRAAQAAAEADLQRVSHDGSLPMATVSLLVTLQEAASRYHVAVVALQPGTTVSENRLSATDLTLRMRGRFLDMIRFLENISRQNSILRVSRTDLALSSRAAKTAEPELDATVHATLYRMEFDHASGEKVLDSDG
jgi:Tfp pilus assembly protein PilO